MIDAAPNSHDVWRFCTALPSVKAFSSTTASGVFVVGLEMAPGESFAAARAAIIAAFPELDSKGLLSILEGRQ